MSRNTAVAESCFSSALVWKLVQLQSEEWGDLIRWKLSLQATDCFIAVHLNLHYNWTLRRSVTEFPRVWPIYSDGFWYCQNIASVRSNNMKRKKGIFSTEMLSVKIHNWVKECFRKMWNLVPENVYKTWGS